MPLYFRGGPSLKVRRNEVRIDAKTGLVLPLRGLSVRSRPDGLDTFGGAYQVTQIPAALNIIQIGRDPDHYEVIPASAMSFDDFQDLLNQIVLVPV
jgi:hypothetical protein